MKTGELWTPDSLAFMKNGKNSLIQNSTLRRDEWELLDDALLMVARERLNVVTDLQNAGLVRPLGGLGVITSTYERSDDFTAADRNMDGQSPGEKDRVDFDEVGVPIPLTFKDFSVRMRQLLASRNRGESLDTTGIERATRVVAEGLEDLVLNGDPNLIVDGNQIFGYTTHPNRNTFTLSGTGWGVESGRDIVGDVRKMLDLAYSVNRFGPFILYVPKNYWAPIQEDYSAEKGDRTFKERIEAYVDITMVKPSDRLADDNVVLVQMTRDSVDLAVGSDIVNIEWVQDPMQTNFKVFAAMAPRIKADRNTSVGIVHATV